MTKQRITQTRPGDALWGHIAKYSPQTVRYMADPNDEGDYRCLVACDEHGAFMGLCIVCIGKLGFGPLAALPVACLENILVVERYRRQGMGTALLQAALADAWRSGVEHVWWTVGYENTDALAFYLANGVTFIAQEDPDGPAPAMYYTAIVQNPANREVLPGAACGSSGSRMKETFEWRR